MAHTRSTHSRKIFTAKGRSKKDTEIEEFSGNGNQGGAWPSRPGEEQYEWEEPRVVADTTRKPSTSQNNREKSEEVSNAKQVEPGGGHCGALRESNRQAQPELGRTTDGTSSGVDPTTNRVDRLRLLGNGVVPQTAERALRILTERIK